MSKTTSSSSPSKTPVQLPEDIQAEILNRLPVQTLARFRCVCKSWHRLFTDPFFINNHLRRHHSTTPHRIILSRYFKSPLSISLHHRNHNLQELHLPFISGHTYYVKGHCHGLICIIINNGDIVLWNPSINQHRILPTPSNFMKTREVLGIGFDSTINDYKIIRAPSSYCNIKVKDYNPQIEILTLTSNSWRKLPDEVTPPYFIEHYHQSVTLNNAVYWLTLDDISTVVLKFSLSEEKFTVVPNPPDNNGRNLSWLGVLNGALCVVHSQRRVYFDIWATRDDCNWERMVSVSKFLDRLRSLDYAPLCFMKNGELVINVRGKGVFAYDEEADEYSKIAEVDDVKWLQETVYTESLVSPHGDGGDGFLERISSSSTRSRNLWKMLRRFTNGVVDHFNGKGSKTK
ncbi:hypothetical protein TanjilG_10745 [Lupinus angustifolius]|uniref:F-box domain-containing protein n=1 Tax=Lupinus angustifolius TaxID=3871 RepID=A0A1J7IK04_LUPAN|nr:PREDICTED: putative F-box protein At3g16210 [Lupinus angustifolius]OIW15305.1 hypothetical protein TanjilG_10745 [Lupinus angustifolius]